MDHEELRDRLSALPTVDPAFLPYAFAWVDEGSPSPVLLSLVPQVDGTVVATRGDLREKVEPVRNPDGTVRVFAQEADACAWAWEELRDALASRPSYSPEQQAAARASGDAQRARIEQLRQGG